jgi:GDP-4-dehydro-6-deoxy-D-mannose reductase
VVVTSADIYGVIRADDLPLTEATEPRPRHPYGVSKWAAGQLVRLYADRYGLPVVEARPFNHIGPRQAKGFVVPDFASQLAAIKLGKQPARMLVGNLSAERDFTDVRDVVRGYRALGESGEPGEAYIICTGTAVSIHWVLMTLLDIAGIDVSIEYDSARMRPSDTPCLYGDYAKLRHDTGWQPQIHLRQSLQDAFADWLDRTSVAE